MLSTNPPIEPIAKPPSSRPDSYKTLVSEEAFVNSEAETERPNDQKPPKTRVNKQGRVIFDSWVLGKTIGTGSSCSVKLVVHKSIGKKCVLKSIKRQCEVNEKIARNRDGIALREHFMIREALVGVSLNHPNIIKMHSYFIGKNHFYFFYEYLEGMDLSDFVTERGQMNECDARHIFKQILDAVDYIHKCNVIHRDLKLENIRIQPSTMKIHLLDFGFSTFYSPKFKQHSSCGSPCYASPEIYLHKPYRGPEVDVWSLGVCLYGVVVGNLPFEQDRFETLTDSVVIGDFYMPEFLSKELQVLINQMLDLNPLARVSIPDIQTSPWIRGITASTLPTLPTPVHRIKALYRSSIDSTDKRFTKIFKSAFTHTREVATTAVAEITARLRQKSSDLIAESAFIGDGNAGDLRGDSNTFSVEWVEDVLRMERHARAEVLMRELQKRASGRQWMLERQWRLEVGLIEMNYGPVLASKTGKKQLAAKKSDAFEQHTRARAIQQMPPMRLRTFIDRVFRKPQHSTSLRKLNLLDQSTQANSSSSWISKNLLPLSAVSRFNITMKSSSGQSTASCNENSESEKPSGLISRALRKWSTVPDFILDSDKENPDAQSATNVSNARLQPDESSVCFGQNKIGVPKSMPFAIKSWWVKKFEVDKQQKMTRGKAPLSVNKTQCLDLGLEFFSDSDSSDTESFECVESGPGKLFTSTLFNRK